MLLKVSEDYSNPLTNSKLAEISEEEIFRIALGEDHTLELNKKVEEAMQDEWDMKVIFSFQFD